MDINGNPLTPIENPLNSIENQLNSIESPLKSVEIHGINGNPGDFFD